MLHTPVMANKVLEKLPKTSKLILDWTLWHGWHSKLILSKFDTIKIIWVDRDQSIINIAKTRLSNFKDRITFIKESYKNLNTILRNKKIDAILLDLWVNMEHFKDPKRGFSIKYDWPLDMRFDTNSKITAKRILNNYTQDKLEIMFKKYWDFKWKLLDRIIKSLEKNKHHIETTFDLKYTLKNAWISEKKIAVIFQALRIETNNELNHLEVFLKTFKNYLNKWWRCLIITYHSVEDRLVKYSFKSLENEWFKNLTKKVIFPDYEEIKTNKASRSAKLRIVEKI